MRGKTVKEMKPGDFSEFTKTITESDVVLFGGITGDLNPAHFNEEYAKGTMFKTRIAHGMLVGSLFSTVLGTSLPGPGSIYISQELKFKKPVYFGDTITAKVEVISIDEEKNRVLLDTTALNQNGIVVVTGQAVIMPPKGE